jgi:hypothetical protein
MSPSRDLGRHVALLVASLAGVVGIGIIFQGAMDGNLAELSRGVPLFLVGTWWAARELGRSMTVARATRCR